MAPTLSEPTILVPFDASDPDPPSPSLVELLGAHRVVALGYWPVPDQSSTDQLRTEYGDEAERVTDEVAARFAAGGAGADAVVAFTHDRSETISRVAAARDADAVLTPGAIEGDVERVLAPIRGEGNLERIVSFLEALLRGSDAALTLLNVPEDDGDDRGEFLLRGVRDRLVADGIDADRVGWRREPAASAGDAIVDAAADHDVVVVGETEPSLRERLLGDVSDRVIEATPRPVLVVRSP